MDGLAAGEAPRFRHPNRQPSSASEESPCLCPARPPHGADERACKNSTNSRASLSGCGRRFLPPSASAPTRYRQRCSQHSPQKLLPMKCWDVPRPVRHQPTKATAPQPAAAEAALMATTTARAPSSLRRLPSPANPWVSAPKLDSEDLIGGKETATSDAAWSPEMSPENSHVALQEEHRAEAWESAVTSPAPWPSRPVAKWLRQTESSPEVVELVLLEMLAQARPWTPEGSWILWTALKQTLQSSLRKL
mmetsp:Transcript_57165/g.152480  ORF Transcript_57165/g.152480 Transcript_57165/m.152480 type:complete len:249 (+) Transcript_57165:1080-1826(+)